MHNIVFWIEIIIIALLSFFEVYRYSGEEKKCIYCKNHMRLFLFTCLIAIIPIFIKDELSGTDSGNYYSWYVGTRSWSSVLKSFFVLGSDAGYKLIILLCKLVGGNFRFQCIVVFILTMIPLFWVVYKKSNYPIFSLFIYLCFYLHPLYDLKRMALAVSICFVAWYLIGNGKNIQAFFLILFATTIHMSALIALGFFAVKKMKKKYVPTIITIGVLGSILFARPVLRMFAAYYRKGSYLKNLAGSGMSGIGFFLFIILLLLITKYVFPAFLKNEENRFSYYTTVVSIPLQIFSFFISTIVRAVYIYFLYIMFVLTDMVTAIKKNYNRWLVTGVIIIGGMVWLWFTGERLNIIKWKYF